MCVANQPVNKRRRSRYKSSRRSISRRMIHFVGVVWPRGAYSNYQYLQVHGLLR